MSWRRFALCKDKFGLCTCWLTLFKFECSSLNDVKVASSVSWMTPDSQTEVLALKMLDIFNTLLFFRNGKLKSFSRNTNFKLALMQSPRFLEAIWVLNSDWLNDSILNGDWLYCHMWRMLYAKLIRRIALFTCENTAHIEFYLQGLLPKILAINKINCSSVRPRRWDAGYHYPILGCVLVMFLD